MRRTPGSLMILLLVIFSLSVAMADGNVWTCPNCGLTGNTGNFCTNCGTAAPAATWTCTHCGRTGNTGNFCPECGYAASYSGKGIVDTGLEQIPGESSQVKVKVAYVTASSYIVNGRDPQKWIPDKAVDGDETTCWQFSTKESALGSAWLQLELPAPQTLDSIWIKNGFWAYTNGRDQYASNCRPREIRVEFRKSSSYSYGDAILLPMKDSRADWQRFSVGNHTDIVSVRLTVLSAYTGSEFKNDVCLSEVMLVRQASSSMAMPPSATQTPGVHQTSGTRVKAKLLMRLSTRSGPATEYDEPGTFFSSNWASTTVDVMGKAWDGNIWWVLVDFTSGNNSYRVWTGLKRVDVNLDLVPEIYAVGQGTVSATETRRGPGAGYAKGPTISSWQDVEAFSRENGYVEVEYHDYDRNRIYRVWVPENKTSIDWN